MKKKILILGVVAILVLMLVSLTGCGNNNERTVENNTNQTSISESDNGIQLIYDFARYVRSEDINQITKIFDLAKIEDEEFERYLKKYLDEKDMSNYNITDIYKADNEQDFKKNIKDKSLSYDTILTMLENLEDGTVPYIVRGTQEGKEFEDIFYLKEYNGTNKIIHSTRWNYTLYSYRAMEYADALPVIYEFASYVRNKDIDKIITIFELANLKGEELKSKLEIVLSEDDMTLYEVDEVLRADTEQDFTENIKDRSLSYDIILTMLENLEDGAVPYIVRGTQAGTEFEDIFYLKEDNGTYKIIHTSAWNYLLY